ncbi:MAG: hypothetical protein GC162_19205 [Planctomycetes bacterium]|nr:hypothetical protein [Planctomycetota bacterium]
MAHPVVELVAYNAAWYRRHWKALVIGFVVFMIVVIVMMILLVAHIMKSSEPYTRAMALARADVRVLIALGQPIEEGFMPTGNIEVHGSSGSADLQISLHGPDARGNLWVTAHRQQGEWTLDNVTFQSDLVPKTNLLKPH